MAHLKGTESEKHSVFMEEKDSDTMRAWSEKSYGIYKKEAASDTSGWDCIVITAADPEQQAAYEAQIELAKQQKQIPSKDTDWVVVPDPPGAKVGPGGSTLFVLSELDKKYGAEKFSTMRVMIIHAGGYSQRLPSMSVCGKIFAALPVTLGGGVPCSMLQLKLAMFCDLPNEKTMIPGVFVTCADDILLFDGGVCDFTRPGFTALAHRSPLITASGHGVFLLPQGTTTGATTAEAFLHKPSDALMREKGAVQTTKLPDGTAEEWAFTDSAFFFDYAVSQKLLKYWNEELVGNITCEIDCYGDFMQVRPSPALGCTSLRPNNRPRNPLRCGPTPCSASRLGLLRRCCV